MSYNDCSGHTFILNNHFVYRMDLLMWSTFLILMVRFVTTRSCSCYYAREQEWHRGGDELPLSWGKNGRCETTVFFGRIYVSRTM